jgi:predicted nucleic acid-binding protein
VNLFLDACVVLAACGRPAGASRAVCDLASRNGWRLMTSAYVVAEVTRNIPRLPGQAAKAWAQIRLLLVSVRDVWTIDRPAVFGPAKDRPVLFTAAAWAEGLLTLDRGDFGAFMRTGFYGLHVLTPGDFLERERAAGRLK